MKRFLLTYAPLLWYWLVRQTMAGFRVLRADQRGAILTAPLFSFGARGALAKALVYFPWKGLDAVRSYVVPANPQTSAQTTQRGYMTSAVALWHTLSFLAIDISAWNRLANLSARARSGFNRFVEEFINEIIDGNVWEDLSDVVITPVSATAFTVNVTKASTGNVPSLRYGTSPTNMPNTIAMTDLTGDDYDADLTSLNANTLYYFTIDVGSQGTDWGRLGVYTYRTPAS